MLIGTRELWPEVASDWYTRFESTFWDDGVAIAGVREFARNTLSKNWVIDVDAGPRNKRTRNRRRCVCDRRCLSKRPNGSRLFTIRTGTCCQLAASPRRTVDSPNSFRRHSSSLDRRNCASLYIPPRSPKSHLNHARPKHPANCFPRPERISRWRSTSTGNCQIIDSSSGNLTTHRHPTDDRPISFNRQSYHASIETSHVKKSRISRPPHRRVFLQRRNRT